MRLHNFSKAKNFEQASDGCCTLAPHASDETKSVLKHETATLTVVENIAVGEATKIKAQMETNKTSVAGANLSAEILSPITADVANITI